MFYTELTAFLRSCSDIADTVTTYADSLGSYPAIFGDAAPEKAEMPYIVFRIEGDKLPDSVIMRSTVNIDYYDYGPSRAKADASAIAVQDALDETKLQSEELTDIRFSLGSNGYIPATDSRTIHYNNTFSTRAARSGWMKRTQ
jgi:hypothetical protein